MNHKDMYKGFEIDGLKVINGFNEWNFNIVIYRNRGFKEEEFYSKRINTYTSSLKEALKEVHTFIDFLGEILYSSNGLLECPYLKSIKEVA